LISLRSELLLLSDDPELLDPGFFDELSFSGNLSPRGMISIPAGFFIFNVAASAEETGVIDTEGLISDPILEAVLLTTEDDDPDCDLGSDFVFKMSLNHLRFPPMRETDTKMT
jgi:hypothetical protein